MELAAVFNPTTALSGSFTATTLQTGSTMIVMNKSYVDLIFTFANGDRRLVIANDRRAFQFSDASVVANGVILWAQENIDYPQTINQLENVCYVEVYAPTEKVVETYPTAIQRETLPSLIPYNIGYSVGVIDYNNNSNAPIIWPSSYYGITTAPKVSQGGTDVGGMGFDYFWTESNMAAPSTIMASLPGNYSTTQKSTNNATLANSVLATNIPGPFSQPGLSPVDSATHLQGNYWSVASGINWSSATSGYLLDMWVNLDDASTGTTQFLYCDDLAHFANTGVAIYVGTNGILEFEASFTGGVQVHQTGYTLSSGQWIYIALLWIPGSITVYVNGTSIFSAPTSGTPVNATHVPRIGSSPQDGGTFTGSIANIGILLTNPFNTPWGPNIVQARYLLGQQSLNVDIQNVWMTEIEIIHQTGGVATTGVSSVILGGVFNPGGQLYASVPVNVNPLHIWRNGLPNSPIWSFGIQPANAVVTTIDRFTNPLTHTFDNFLLLEPTQISPGAIVTTTIRGYNILGIG